MWSTNILCWKLQRAFKLSSNLQFFYPKFEPLKKGFARLYYPETVVKNTISRHFIETKFTENACLKQRVFGELDAPVRIVLPFKDQKSANAVRHQRRDLSRKIDVDVQPVYTSQKIKEQFKPKDHKPLIVNQQNVVYSFKYGLCDVDYVGFRSRHLHQQCGGVQAINNRQPRKVWTWKGPRDHYKQFQSLKKVSEQTRLFDFWNAFFAFKYLLLFL